MNLPNSRRDRRPALTALSTLAILVSLAASAQAATIKLKCTGPGPRNVDSAGTISCAANAGKSRSIAGTVRNDAGQPVAAKVSVTRSLWTPSPGGGYSIKSIGTKEIAAMANGTFSYRTSPKTRESFRFDLVADPTLGIAGGAFAQADVLRRLIVTVSKLGGGKVRLTVKGTKQRPLKVWITDKTGYAVPGVKPKNANRKGKATFNLGASTSGRFSYFVDAGKYQDLFWYEPAGTKTFKLKNGS